MTVEQHEHRWTERPVLSGLVGATSFLLPIAVSVAAAVTVSRVLPPPDGPTETVAWWLGLTAVTIVSLVAVDRLARRLLPLAALLRMSMLFPDRAPSRFRVAFRAGTVRDLERRVSEARTRGQDDEPAKAAETILTLAAALSAHDRKTRGHSERVRAFTDLLATEMRLPPEDCDRLRWAALLHDIGKLGVAPAILNKEGEPDQDEWAVIHRHPEEGARLVAPLRAWLGPWAESIEHHHEKWDGSGYPFGLSGTDISLGARIVAVADSYEVMTAIRSYKKSMTAADARRELASCAGIHFDPAVVRAFLNLSLGRLRWAMGPIAWLGQLPFVGGLPRMAVGPLAQGTGGVSPSVVGGAVAVASLGLAGVMSTSSPNVAVATETGPPAAVEQVGGIAVDDEPLERLAVRPGSGPGSTGGGPASAGPSAADNGGDGSGPPVGGPSGEAVPPPPAEPGASGPVTTSAPPAAAPGAGTDRSQVLGESVERSPAPGPEPDGATRPTTSSPSTAAPAPPPTTGGAKQPEATPRADGDARDPRPPRSGHPGRGDDGDDGDDEGDDDEDGRECNASERGLERGAATDHPVCDFRGERDD